MTLSNPFQAYLRTLQREHRDNIIQKQSSFAAEMFEVNAVGTSQFPQGMANVARESALEFVRKACTESGALIDLTEEGTFEEAFQAILASTRELLAIGSNNILHPVHNQPANAIRAIASSEFEQDVRDRLLFARESRKVEPSSAVRRWNLLFLVSNPSDEQTLATNVEYREVQSAIREAAHRDQINLVLESATRIRDVVRAVNEHVPRVVHFSGHGNQTCLALLDNSNQTKPFDAQFFAEILTDEDQQVKLVVFNSCHSMPQARKLLTVVPHVVGTTDVLDDDVALLFSHAFYSALAYGRTIAVAYNQAIVRIRAEMGVAAGAVYELSSSPDCSPGALTLATGATRITSSPVQETLSHWEKKLLRSAPKSGDIHVLERDQSGKWVQSGETNFRDDTDASVAALALEALESLVEKNLVRHNTGIHYSLTGTGWNVKRDIG